MSMIFPGMDPYLEEPAGWQGVHNAMVVYIRDQLQPQLLPRFVAALEARVFVESPSRDDRLPDVFVMKRRRRRQPRPSPSATRQRRQTSPRPSPGEK